MHPRRPLFSIALWLEVALLVILASTTGAIWLLPLAACAGLLAGISSSLLGLGIFTCISATGTWIWLFFQGSHNEILLSAHPISALLLGGALAFLNILSSLQKSSVASLQHGLARLAVFLHFLTAGLLLGALYLKGAWLPWLAMGFALFNAILVTDCLLRLVARLYTPHRHWSSLTAPGAFFFFRWLGSEWNAYLPPATQRDESYDLKLAEMWMWPTVKAALPALLTTMLALVWLLTCIHEIPVGNQGIRQGLGVWETTTLSPGIHTSLPWPLGSIQSVDTAHLREVVLGFRTDPGQPILWEKAHYEDEQMSLVSGGDDLLTISVPILYRISNPALYLRSGDDAEAMLRSLAQRLLISHTLRLSARDIMTTSRESLRKQLHQDLQSSLDERQSGLTISEIYLRDIHPPVAVAPTFQEVVSALEEKEASVYEGEAYRRDNITRAEGAAKATLITAQSTSQNRLLQAQGQASRFTSRQQAWAQAKELYQWREGYQALDETLSGAKKAIFDESMRGDMPTHVDLRKVLNPDFVDTIPPSPQSLVPRPAKSRDTFDLDIDGYLQMGRGEVPATDTEAPDADNILKPQSPMSQP